MPKIETNAATILKSLNSDIDGVVKDSVNHAAKLASVTARSILFAAEHGQCGPLTRLHKEVSIADAEGIRICIVNMNAKYGVSVTGADGEDRMVSFLKFKKTEGFSLNTSDNENVLKGIKASKASVIKAGEKELSKLPFGKMDRDAAMDTVFDSIETVKRAIRTLARNGDGPMARAVNRVLGTNGLTVDEIDETAKKNDPRVKLAEAEKAAQKLRDQVAKLPANTNLGEQAVSSAVN